MDDTENNDVHMDGFALVQNADADCDMLASDETTFDHDENVSHGSRFESNEGNIAHGETGDEIVFSQDDNDYDDEESRWASRQNSNHSDEDSTYSSDEKDELQKLTDDDWNEYRLDLVSTHQEQEMKNLDDSLSTGHELTNGPNDRWEDTERAEYGKNGLYEIKKELHINSHSHDTLHDSVKSMAV